MPFFSKVFKSKDAAAVSAVKSKNQVASTNGHAIAPAKPRFTATWTSKEIDLEEVQELIHACTIEMKSRAEALDAPFLLLPFRPETDVGPARTFIRNFYAANQAGSPNYTGASLRKELVLTEPAVLCSILKWCWSRMPGGVVTWTTYEGFRMGEQDSLMARNAFSTFIPLCVDSSARRSIIFDFFDVLATIAAHGKLNGLGGRKLSRMAAWWAFEHTDDGKGFDGGYKSWSTAADASSHLFFAYLRSLTPEALDGFSGINALPRSLQSLLAQTDYPPEAPSLMLKKTPKVVMLVDNVSPGPFALLRRAKHFEYRDAELQAFSEYDDPVQALTEECKRVLNCIASANQSIAARSRSGMQLTIGGLGNKPDESWSRFQDFGFTDFSESMPNGKAGLVSAPRSRANNKGRPTTPSWADFLNSGFADEATAGASSTTLLLPPKDVLPPIAGTMPRSSDGLGDEDLEPGELASITHFDLDDTFWWVWMTSLASEEPSGRKAVFGRCALIETRILGGKWLVMEEQVKGASVEPEEGAYIVEKKSRFGFSRKNRAARRRSMVPPKSPVPPEAAQRALSPTKASMSPDQQEKIRSAAAVLAQQSKDPRQDPNTQRRGRIDDGVSTKTNSIMTLGLTNAAGPAMKWARDFDREAIRKQYLGDDFAGKGGSKDMAEAIPEVKESPAASPEMTSRELPPAPKAEVAEVIKVDTPASTPAIPAAAAKPQPEDSIQKTEKPVQPVPMQPPPPKASSEIDTVPRQQPATSIDRKPVPRTAPRLNNIHDHPAFRNKGQLHNPAEIAAKSAWGVESRAYSPEPLKKSKEGGFRRMFGMKKEKSSPTVSSLKPPESRDSHRASLLRKKPPPGSAQAYHTDASNYPVEPTARTPSIDPPTPTAQAPLTSAEGSLSRVDTQDRADAEHAFSRFDQGPLEDAPAFVPRESIDSYAGASEASMVNPDHVEAPGAFPETPMEYPSPMEHGAESNGSSLDAPMTGQDRWAQIKRNAAERVARMSEDQSSRPAHSIITERTEDDGETSGEETIEARVARIKARVAELTGNMEPSNGVHH